MPCHGLAAGQAEQPLAAASADKVSDALAWQDAQRSRLATPPATLQARLAELQNRLALYRGLGDEQALLPAP